MITKLINSFEAPDFVRHYIIPVFVLSILGYVIGLPFVIRDVKRGGYDQVIYDDLCENKNKNRCKEILNKKDFDKCVKNQNKLRCDSRIEKSGKNKPLLVYAFVPLVVAFIIGGMFYRLLIFIKNPKVAAGYFLFKGLTDE